MQLLKNIFLFLLFILFSLFAFVFITRNTNQVAIDFLFYKTPYIPFSLWLILFFILGGILGVLTSLYLLIKERRLRKQIEKRLKTTSELITGPSN